MGSRRETKACEAWRELRRQVREAADAVERAALWVHALPEVPEWFEHWVECASELATKRQALARAREVVRGERIRKVLRRREELAGPREPVFTPLPPLRQAALFFGALTPTPTRPPALTSFSVDPGPLTGTALERLAWQGSYRPLSRASLTGVPCGRCVPCFKGCHCTKGTDGACQCGAMYGEPGAFARSLSSPPEDPPPPAVEQPAREVLDEQLPPAAVELLGDDGPVQLDPSEVQQECVSCFRFLGDVEVRPCCCLPVCASCHGRTQPAGFGCLAYELRAVAA